MSENTILDALDVRRGEDAGFLLRAGAYIIDAVLIGVINFVIGMIIGTPVPIVGSFIGGMLAVFLLEFVRTGDHDHAFKSGESAFWVVLASMFVEFLMAVTVVITTIISIVITA